ncbi:MAG TPA: hypothetical protein V6C81_12595 [Planktothrix sp.]|jgi:hypothetical protein
MKVLAVIVLIVIMVLAIWARFKVPSRAVRVLQMVRRDEEAARRITVATASTAANPRQLPVVQSSNSSPRGRVRSTCQCNIHGRRHPTRVYDNVVCIRCRGSLPVLLAD